MGEGKSEIIFAKRNRWWQEEMYLQLNNENDY